MIKFYKLKDPYGFMSNFYKSKMTIYGKTWEWLEAPYQSRKTDNESEINKIFAAKTARESREIGQLVQLRPNWDTIRVQVMKECLLAKFTQNKDLLIKLIETGDEELVEDSPVDYFFGCGADGSGKNMLGKLLMEVREELKEKK